MKIADAALQWRVKFGYVGRGGVIVLFDGNAQGWVNELRNPEHWCPGCVAVDEAGLSWIATGGDEQNGAEAWMAVVSASSKRPASSVAHFLRIGETK